MLTQLHELLQYRDLVRNLVVSELKARYKNSVLGFVWSLLNPLGMMLVFWIVLGFLAPSGATRRDPLFLLCGLLPWNFFSASVMASINSVVGNANLVKKVYFPREVLPVATTIAQLINFLLAFVVLFVVVLARGADFSPWLPILPFVIIIQTIFTLGMALFLSTLNVFYRDTLMIMEVLMLAWFFLTPVIYSVYSMPQQTEWLGITWNIQRLAYILNPMASIINVYRDLLYGGYRTDLDFFLRTIVTALAVFILGYWFFRRYSPRFGEEL